MAENAEMQEQFSACLRSPSTGGAQIIERSRF
jgi:hypothetical protein